MDAILKKKIATFLSGGIQKSRILIVGDVMLDRYLSGEVTRISPEAPVPVNLINSVRETLGGAANVAHNLARLGCQTFLCGVVGRDHYHRLLARQLIKLQIPTDGLLENRSRTTTKIRVLGGHQQMIRLDFEETKPLDKAGEQDVINYCKKRIKDGVDAIIISDYNKGLCSDNVCQSIIREAHCNRDDICVFVDPKGADWKRYRNADYITPNVRELSEVLGESLLNDDIILGKAAKCVKEKYGISNVMVTRSEKGISFYGDGKIRHLPTVAQDVYDVSGAGDTVIATFAAAISKGMNIFCAAYLANYAAGIEVSKVGTYAVSNDEIIDQLDVLSMR